MKFLRNARAMGTSTNSYIEVKTIDARKHSLGSERMIDKMELYRYQESITLNLGTWWSRMNHKSINFFV
jgi:hypothetical protein